MTAQGSSAAETRVAAWSELADRTPAYALVAGVDGVAIENSAMQAIGCIGMRACHTNNCPVGIATQNERLRKRFEIGRSSLLLKHYLEATIELMKILARACGHDHLGKFNPEDLTTWKREIAELTGVRFAGVGL